MTVMIVDVQEAAQNIIAALQSIVSRNINPQGQHRIPHINDSIHASFKLFMRC